MYNPARIMLANLRVLFGVIIDIVLFRRAPDSVPASPLLLTVAVVAYGVVTALVASAVASAHAGWPLELLVGTVVTLAWYHLALTRAQKRERFAQTMTAMFAVRMLFTPALLPLTSALLAQGKGGSPPSALLGLVAIVLVVWLIAVHVHIVRAALEWRTPVALVLVIGQEVAAMIVFAMMIGVPEKAG